MFNVDVRFLVGGRPITFDGFVDSVLAEVARRVRAENRNLPQGRPVVAEMPRLQREEGERKGAKPLAVGVDEAGKLLGLSPWTIRQYVARGRIRAVRIGRRVLVPMEVLEKVMVEGVELKPKGLVEQAWRGRETR